MRSYHGHLSGVYCLGMNYEIINIIALHPSLDILVTGGRDSVGRMWDMRTKAQIHILDGHQDTIGSIVTQDAEPQIITGLFQI